MPKPKVQASSSRIAVASPSAFSFGGTPATDQAPSTLSYFADLPDVSRIVNPNITVSFKSLFKKDGTTKARALEDLQTHLGCHPSDVDDGVLEAWVGIYPRLSIDADRRVRQLAHAVQATVASAAGKRILKHLPNSIGPWLLGLYDSDKPVAAAAQVSLEKVFQSLEKRTTLRTVYQKNLVEFALDIVHNESATTLSYEPAVGPTEAAAKYNRTLAAAIRLVSDLLRVAEVADKYNHLADDQKLLASVSSEDASVRRAIHKFVRVCLDTPPIHESLNVSHLSSWYVSKGLGTDQTGSATDFVETLTTLTVRHPSIWTSSWSGKKPPHVSLRHFLRSGSQSGPTTFWVKLGGMLNVLPKEAYPDTPDGATSLLKAFQSGLTRKEEPRSSLVPGLPVYLRSIPRVSSQLSAEEQKAILLATIEPLAVSLLFCTDKREWDIPEANAIAILREITRLNFVSDTLMELWTAISATLVMHIKTLLPETSSEFELSQNRVAAEAERWAITSSQLFAFDAKRILPETIRYVLSETINVAMTRNGKPYGAAAAIAYIAAGYPHPLVDEHNTRKVIDDFLTNKLSQIFPSRSSVQLAQVLQSQNMTPEFEVAWSQCLIKAVESIYSSTETAAIRALFKSLPNDPKRLLSACESDVRILVLHYLELALDEKESWNAVVELLGAIDDMSLHSTCMEILTASLTPPPERTKSALRGYCELFKRQEHIPWWWCDQKGPVNLSSTMLRLTEASDDEVAQLAREVLSHMGKTLNRAKEPLLDPYVRAIDGELHAASKDSALVTTLATAAEHLRETMTVVDLNPLIPNLRKWATEMHKCMTRADHYITAHPKGAFFVYPSHSVPQETLDRDGSGLSIPIRMAMYTVRLLSNADDCTLIGELKMSTIFQLLVQTTLLAEQKISVDAANDLWSPNTPEVEADVVDFISESHKFVSQWLKSCEWWLQPSDTYPETSDQWRSKERPAKFDFVNQALSGLYMSMAEPSVQAYFALRAYSQLTNELINIHGVSSRRLEKIAEDLEVVRKSKVVWHQLADLSAYGPVLQSVAPAKRWYNELVAEVSGLDLTSPKVTAIRSLALLQTAVADQQPAFIASAASPRLAFLVKHLTEALTARTETEYRVLCLSILNSICPALVTMSGVWWDRICLFIEILWSAVEEFSVEHDDLQLSLVYESVKLYSTLEKMATAEDCNGDLLDVMTQTRTSYCDGLLRVMLLDRSIPDELHAPLRMVDMAISRAVDKVKPFGRPVDVHSLYRIMGTNSDSLQNAGFKILHADIPALGEELSIKAVLEAEQQKLPDELLSLVAAFPKMKPMEDFDLDDRLPLSLKGYLLTWILVFDHYTNASHVLRGQYAASLKQSGVINGLLDFIFDYLGHSFGKPVSADNIDPTSDELDYGENTRRSLQPLLIRLYYLSLLYASSLVKTWWIECKSRLTVQHVEAWTAKHMSPRLIASALQTVQDWSKRQEGIDTDDGGRPLAIKVHPAAGEVVATYAIEGDDDERPLVMLVKLPASFPLQQAVVSSLTERPAFEDRLWKGWLRTAQGVIAFSENSIVDGLVAWRNNIVGQLTDREQCTICYTLVDEDGKLPSRRCRTCKNSFHLVCLNKWFATGGNKQCPLCRAEFKNMART